MTTRITRRTALGAGAAIATTGLTGGLIGGAARAQIPTTATPALNLPIEAGATLRMLRPVRFVAPDEEVFRANCAAFTAKTGVQVRVDFVGWEDITQQTAVTANTGAGPDTIIAFDQAPHIYSDKIIDLSDVAGYLGQKYGGWRPLAEAYGKRQGKWIGLPFGSTGGPLIWRKSAVNEAGFQTIPDDLDGFLKLCQAMKRINKPVGFALGNAVGDGNAFCNWVIWSHGAYLVNEDGTPGINSKETVEALTYLKELYQSFVPGTLAWGDASNNRAYAGGECFATQNGVSLYFGLKGDPATAAVAEDTQMTLMPKGKAASTPNAGLTMNAMVFKHSRYPNAAKALLTFLLEAEQYDPWLQANLGYWSQPLNAYAQSKVWSSDPKISVFKDTMNSQFWLGYKGPITEGSAAATADYVIVQMCASVCSGQATPQQAAAEAERRARRFFRAR